MAPTLPALALAVATLLCACGDGEGGSNAVLAGSVSVRPLGGAWAPVGVGPVNFESGTSIEATAAGATLDASIGGSARAEFRLGPGARLSRRGTSAFDFAVGTVTVTTSGLGDRLLIYHADAYAEAGRLVPGDQVFAATTTGDRLAIVVERGGVQLNVLDPAKRALTFAELGPGEQGLGASGGEPEKRHMNDSKAGAYLTPRIGLSAEPGGAGDPLRAVVTIAAGQSGTFHGVMAPDALTIVAAGPGGDREIALDARHAGGGTTLPPTVTAQKDAEFVLPFETLDHGLTVGTWTLRARYISYREHSDGPEWLGVVESAPVSVTISD